MKKNKELKSFYDRIYEKGERKHYTPKLALSATELPVEDREVINTMSWRGKTVLDVGCGTGRACYEIAQRGAQRVVGIDFSEAAIARARARPMRDNLEYHVQDLAAHRGRYDVVIAIGTLEHTDDPYATLKSLKRRLNKNMRGGGGGEDRIDLPELDEPSGLCVADSAAFV